MILHYDLHIHTCLSPCGFEEMTPNNIVNMCAVKGLDLIAVTDHNHYGNVEAVVELAKAKDILCIPGLEVQTKEEVHVLCYFSSVEILHVFAVEFETHRIKLKNESAYLGKQIFMDREDQVVGECEYTLLTSVDLSMEALEKLVLKYNGVMVPAHINRPANSVLANLGFMPPTLNVKTVEVYKWLDCPSGTDEKYRVIYNSDAHKLEFISEAVNAIEVEEKAVDAILKYLRGV